MPKEKNVEENYKLAPGKYEVIGVDGDDISLRHINGTGKIHIAQRRNTRNIEKGAADKYTKVKIVELDKNEHAIDVISA